MEPSTQSRGKQRAIPKKDMEEWGPAVCGESQGSTVLWACYCPSCLGIHRKGKTVRTYWKEEGNSTSFLNFLSCTYIDSCVCVCVAKFTILTILKCTIQWHEYIYNVTQPSPLSSSRTLPSLRKETLYLLNSHSPFSSSPLVFGNHPSTSAHVECHIQIVHIGGDIQNVVFCVWLLSPSKIFSKSIHTVVCIRTSLFIVAK